MSGAADNDPPPMAQVPSGCPYVAPGSTTLETKPVGTVLHGINQIKSQSTRWPKLLSWWWRIEAVPLTSTEVDITITCVGPPQVLPPPPVEPPPPPPPIEPPPPPPPTPIGITSVLTDELGASWTLGTAGTGGFQTLRDGAQAGGGYGVGYLLSPAGVVVQNSAGKWYLFTNGTWTNTVDPRLVVLPPVEPPPPPPVEPPPPPPPSLPPLAGSRLMFDAAALTALRATTFTTSPDHALWQTWKAGADALLTVPPQYGYAGDGFPGPIAQLGLAYLITGDTRYSSKVKEIVGAILALGPDAILGDSGYPTRNLPYALALAYSWCRDAYTATEKTAIIARGNEWFDHYAARHVIDSDGPALSNYFGGHLLGFGLWGLGTASDNPRSQEVMDLMRARWVSVQTAFASGIFQGGFPAEGFTYGVNHFVRLLQYAQSVRAVTGEDLASGMGDTILTSLIHSRLPNRWQFPVEADYAGDYSGIMSQTLIVMLTGLCSPTYAGYAQYFHQTMNSSAGMAYPAARSLLWGAVVAPIDYRQTFPIVRRSPGDGRVTVRTDWSDGAVVNTFKAGAQFLGGHAMRGAGHIFVQRGNDPLLVNAGQWKGPGGWGGNPQVYDGHSWFANTLAYPTSWNVDYIGGQGYWGTEQILASGDGAGYHWTVADLTNAYNRGDGPSDLQKYIRTQVVFPDGTSVLRDHVVGPSAPKEIAFHGHQAGPWAITGNRAVSQVGVSQIAVTSLTHTGLRSAATPVSATDPTPTTHRLVIADTAADVVFVTVLQPGARGVTPAPVSGDRNGATVGTVSITFTSDGMPNIGVFSIGSYLAPEPALIPNPTTSGPYAKRCILHAPVAGETLIQPVGLRLVATAVDAEVGGLVAGTTKVEFYIDGSLAATSISSITDEDGQSQNIHTHSTRLTNVSLSVGNHTVHAKSYDNFGGSYVSPSRRIAVVARPTYAATHTLTANTAVVAAHVGDADNRILFEGPIQATLWKLTGSVVTFAYCDFIGCDFDFTTTANVTFEHCRFFECGDGLVTQNGGATTCSVTNNLWASNSRFHLDQNPELQGSAFCWVWAGSSTGAKVFESNNIGAGSHNFQSRNWTIGGDFSSQANIWMGVRGGFWPSSNFTGTFSRNFSWNDYPAFMSQGGNCELGSSSTPVAVSLMEHNVIGGGSWPVRFLIGEFRYNLVWAYFAEGPIWLQGAANPHHNFIFGATCTHGTLFQIYGGTTSAYNNTIHTPTPHAESVVHVESGTMALHSTLFIAGPAGVVDPSGGTITADYCGFTACNASHYSDARATPAHDVTGDALLTEPYPNNTPQWDPDAVWNRTFTVHDILGHARRRYTPTALMLGTGNPAIEAGNSIGCVGTGTALDRFGVAA